ncbi:unnamed protein product, partial [Discosporangium mesarthrocarpum]
HSRRISWGNDNVGASYLCLEKVLAWIPTCPCTSHSLQIRFCWGLRGCHAISSTSPPFSALLRVVRFVVHRKCDISGVWQSVVGHMSEVSLQEDTCYWAGAFEEDVHTNSSTHSKS